MCLGLRRNVRLLPLLIVRRRTRVHFFLHGLFKLILRRRILRRSGGCHCWCRRRRHRRSGRCLNRHSWSRRSTRRSDGHRRRGHHRLGRRSRLRFLHRHRRRGCFGRLRNWRRDCCFRRLCDWRSGSLLRLLRRLGGDIVCHRRGRGFHDRLVCHLLHFLLQGLPRADLRIVIDCLN